VCAALKERMGQNGVPTREQREQLAQQEQLEQRKQRDDESEDDSEISENFVEKLIKKNKHEFDIQDYFIKILCKYERPIILFMLLVSLTQDNIIYNYIVLIYICIRYFLPL